VRANHLDTENLKPGDELILVKCQPHISVIAQVEGEKVETIPFETKTEIDNNASGVRIKQDGRDGEKKIVYVATKVNGSVDEQEIKEETVLKEAVARVLVKGKTVTVASRGGGGAIDWPVYGQITKYYQRGHTGLDIGARSGSTIRAADSGTVTFTGWQGGYGNFIIVNHGNGMITRYAHCSKISVSKGQQVARGETIGAVGSTGRSTGPHLHFEVLSGGSFQNPLSYLR
jgi:murein DD-endopeptidase MepM/ murein hydrolase activator NlpD